MSQACADSGYGYLSQDRISSGVTVAGHQKRVTTTGSMARKSLACSECAPESRTNRLGSWRPGTVSRLPAKELIPLDPSFNRPGMDSVWAIVFDQGEGSDILDAIVAEGRCRTCGTPWDRVVKVDGKRPV